MNAPTICDCERVFLPVGVYSAICADNTEHSETACVPCPVATATAT